jgi:hypothetical protein
MRNINGRIGRILNRLGAGQRELVIRLINYGEPSESCPGCEERIAKATKSRTSNLVVLKCPDECLRLRAEAEKMVGENRQNQPKNGPENA